MLNPVEKFKVAILHLNRDWNHWIHELTLHGKVIYILMYYACQGMQHALWCAVRHTTVHVVVHLFNWQSQDNHWMHSSWMLEQSIMLFHDVLIMNCKLYKFCLLRNPISIIIYINIFLVMSPWKIEIIFMCKTVTILHHPI